MGEAVQPCIVSARVDLHGSGPRKAVRGTPERNTPWHRGAERGRSWRWRSAPGLRRSEIASLVWDDITPTARAGQTAGPRAGPRRPTPRATARTCGCSPPASPALSDRLRTAEEPAAADRVVPISPHQVNHRVQVLAEALGLEGVSSHSGRRGLASELVRRGASTTAVQAAGGWQSAAMVARYSGYRPDSCRITR